MKYAVTVVNTSEVEIEASSPEEASLKVASLILIDSSWVNSDISDAQSGWEVSDVTESE